MTQTGEDNSRPWTHCGFFLARFFSRLLSSFENQTFPHKSVYWQSNQLGIISFGNHIRCTQQTDNHNYRTLFKTAKKRIDITSSMNWKLNGLNERGKNIDQTEERKSQSIRVVKYCSPNNTMCYLHSCLCKRFGFDTFGLTASVHCDSKKGIRRLITVIRYVGGC